MEYFQVRYDSRVVIYERKMFIRLATGQIKQAIVFKARSEKRYSQWEIC